MKRRFLFIAMFVATVCAVAQKLPQQGQVMYFGFDGSLVEKHSGQKLQKFLGEGKMESVSNPQFVATPDGEKAYLATGRHIIKKSLSGITYPELTMVLRLKLKEYGKESHYYLYRQLSNIREDLGTAVRFERVSNKEKKLSISGYSEPNSSDVMTMRSEKSLLDGYTTLIFTYSVDSTLRHVVVDNNIYKFYENNTAGDKRESHHFCIGSDSATYEIDYIAAYDRLLTEEEMAAIVGEELVPVEFYEEEEVTSGLLILGLLTCLFFITPWYVLYRRRHLYPEITAEYVMKHGTLGSGSRDEAMALLEEARGLWNYTSDGLGGFLYGYPSGRYESWKSRRIFNKALAVGCTDEDFLQQCNEFARAYNRGQDYSFRGYAFMPILAICGYMGMMAMKAYSSPDDFWLLMQRAVFNREFVGVLLIGISYIVISFCPNNLSKRGEWVTYPEKKGKKPGLLDKVDFGKGFSSLAGFFAMVVALGGVAVIGAFRLLSYAIENSAQKVHLYRGSQHVGTRMELNPAGLGAVFLAGVAVIFIFVVFSWVFFFGMFVINPIRFVRNHIIRW